MTNLSLAAPSPLLNAAPPPLCSPSCRRHCCRPSPSRAAHKAGTQSNPTCRRAIFDDKAAAGHAGRARTVLQAARPGQLSAGIRHHERASRQALDMINTGIFWTEERSKLMYMVPTSRRPSASSPRASAGLKTVDGPRGKRISVEPRSKAEAYHDIGQKRA